MLNGRFFLSFIVYFLMISKFDGKRQTRQAWNKVSQVFHWVIRLEVSSASYEKRAP